MTDLRNLKVDDLKDIARNHGIAGAWKKTKDQLIAAIIKNATANGCNDYFDSNEEVEEVVEETVEEEVEEEPKTKKPNLKLKELTFNGKTQTIKDWAAELQIPWPTLYDRVNRNGWTVEDALTTPLGARRKK